MSIAATQDAAADTNAEPIQLRSRRLVPRALLGFGVPVGVLFLWEVGARYGLIDARLMPPPSRISNVFGALAVSGDLFRHVEATLLRVGLGFAIGAGTGTLLGAASGAVSIIRVSIDPTIQALRAIPSIAWVPLFILWFGIFETSKIALIAVGVSCASGPRVRRRRSARQKSVVDNAAPRNKIVASRRGGERTCPSTVNRKRA